MRKLHLRTTLTFLALSFGLPALAVSQDTDHEQEIEGFVRAADSGEPLAGATVTVVGTANFATTHGDGSFHLPGLPLGEYTIQVERLGYRSVSLEVVVTQDIHLVEVELYPAPVTLSAIVVTGSITPRSEEDALRPVNVLSGEDLQRRLAGTVAATLESEAGLAVTSMGPATARPVIRGLSGDRVLMLEDGARVGDVSNASSDHANALDPSSARRIEVVRGPGAILYGSNALGGVINVIRDEVPTASVHHPTGALTLSGRSVNSSLGGSGETRFNVAEHVPVRIELSGSTAGDLNTPVGTLQNTDLTTWTASGGTSWVDDWGHVGSAFRYYANRYGIPGGFVGGHEDGVTIDMQRTSTKVSALKRDSGPFESVSFTGGHTWYKHEELEPGDILGTQFKRQTVSGEVLARHGEAGVLTAGAVGARASWGSYGFGGSLSTPDSRRVTVAMFGYEEIDLDPLRVEAGLRFDWARVRPLREDLTADIGPVRQRDFTAVTGSVGALFSASPNVTLGMNVARAFRIPDVNELFSEGPHLAAYAFEVGNPDLESETGIGVDAFARWASDNVAVEVTVFRNDLSGYVFPRETGDTSRVRLPIYQHTGVDALLKGIETSVTLGLTDRVSVEGTTSWVEGSLSETGDPLPLMPPFQARFGASYETPVWFVDGDVRFAGEQTRLGPFETATDGYTTLSAAAGLRLTLAGRLHILTLSLENLTDAEYRNHLSRVKDIMPEAGRNISLTYRVLF